MCWIWMQWNDQHPLPSQKGQLARDASDAEECAAGSSSSAWHSVPGLVKNIGPKEGKRATWIGASGDQTFLKLDESLVNEDQFKRSTVISSDNCFGTSQ